MTVVALILVLVPGRHGPVRLAWWLKLGPLPSFQPSELAKVAVVIYMADWLARKGKNVSRFTTGSIPFLIILSVIAGLVVVEPDMGTAVIICAVAFSVFFVAGGEPLAPRDRLRAGRHPDGRRGEIAAPYRAERFAGFLTALPTRSGKGWQAMPAFIALGSGGLTGVGFGDEPPEGVLPAERTHRLYLAIIGEELGLIGTMVVIVLLMVIGWRGLRIALRAPDPYGRCRRWA